MYVYTEGNCVVFLFHDRFLGL